MSYIDYGFVLNATCIVYIRLSYQDSKPVGGNYQHTLVTDVSVDAAGRVRAAVFSSWRESSNQSEFVRNVGRRPCKWACILAWKGSVGTLGSGLPVGRPLLEVAFRLDGHPWKWPSGWTATLGSGLLVGRPPLEGTER